MPALTMPANEGFWAGTSHQDRVLVQLAVNDESRHRVKRRPGRPGGAVVTHAAKFAVETGADTAEGADLLTNQRAHVSVHSDAVTLAALTVSISPPFHP